MIRVLARQEAAAYTPPLEPSFGPASVARAAARERKCQPEPEPEQGAASSSGRKLDPPSAAAGDSKYAELLLQHGWAEEQLADQLRRGELGPETAARSTTDEPAAASSHGTRACPLPPGWEARTGPSSSGTGKWTYYVNRETGASQYERPGCAAATKGNAARSFRQARNQAAAAGSGQALVDTASAGGGGEAWMGLCFDGDEDGQVSAGMADGLYRMSGHMEDVDGDSVAERGEESSSRRRLGGKYSVRTW